MKWSKVISFIIMVASFFGIILSPIFTPSGYTSLFLLVFVMSALVFLDGNPLVDTLGSFLTRTDDNIQE